MKKRFWRIAILIIVIAAGAFTGCASSSLSEAEKTVLGKYELTEISMSREDKVSDADLAAITVSKFEYFTMEFKSDRKCYAQSKDANGTHEVASAWIVNAKGEIVVTTKKDSASATEKYVLSDNILVGGSMKDGVLEEGNIGVYKDVVIIIKVKFTKVA